MAKIIIGRKIKIIKKDKDGNEQQISVGKVKDYFKFINKNEVTTINKRLLGRILDFDKKEKTPNLNNVDSIVAFSMLQGLKKCELRSEDVKSAIEAISSKNKQALNTVLPVKFDKNDLSKGAFLPWNRKQRNEIVKIADENSDIMESIGEYEPNPIKRFFKYANKALLANSKQELITDGNEKVKERKLNVKVNEIYNNLQNRIENMKNMDELSKLYKEEYKKVKPELSREESKELENLFRNKVNQLDGENIETAEKINNQEKEETER